MPFGSLCPCLYTLREEKSGEEKKRDGNRRGKKMI